MFDRAEKEADFMRFLGVRHPEKLGIRLLHRRRWWFLVGVGILCLILAILAGCELEDSNDVVFESKYYCSVHGEIEGFMVLVWRFSPPLADGTDGGEYCLRCVYQTLPTVIKPISFDPNVGSIRGRERPEWL